MRTNETPIATEAARVLGLLKAAMNNITNIEYIVGLREELDALIPQSPTATDYFANTFSFEYDPNTSELTGPVIARFHKILEIMNWWELAIVGIILTIFFHTSVITPAGQTLKNAFQGVRIQTALIHKAAPFGELFMNHQKLEPDVTALLKAEILGPTPHHVLMLSLAIVNLDLGLL